MDKFDEITKAITVTAELTNTTLSGNALLAMGEELESFDLGDVLTALNRCRRELTGRLTLAAILERIDMGYPSENIAWGLIVESWRHEDLAVCLPEVAQLAGGAAYDIFHRDPTGARMAFKEAYTASVQKAKDLGQKCIWTVSAGTDKAQMAHCITSAVKEGKLSPLVAQKYLPTEATEERHLMLTGQVMTPEQRQIGRQHTGKLLALLGSKVQVL